jgi:hypothetical protein
MNSARRVLQLAIVGLTLVGTLAFAAGFKVSSVQPRVSGQTLFLGVSIELGLTPEVEEAIGNGIPVELAIDARLYRQRAFMWDKKVTTWKLRRELRYYALTGQYLIGAGGGAPLARESFTSLNEALVQMGALADLALPLNAPLAPDAQYHLEVRVALDIEALPALLRPVAYTSRAWHLNSGWTTWKVQR